MDNNDALRILSKAMPHLAGPLVGGMPLDAFDMRVRSITASYDVAGDDMVILADASGGAITVGLPPAAGALQQVFYVKKIDSSSNAVTIDPYGSETVDGETTYTLGAQYSSVCIYCDGNAWYTLSGTAAGSTIVAGVATATAETTTSSTSYVDLSSLSVTLSLPKTCKVLAVAALPVKNDAEGSLCYLRLVDGSGNQLGVEDYVTVAGANYFTQQVAIYMGEQSSGSLTVKAQWKTSAHTSKAQARSLVVLAW